MPAWVVCKEVTTDNDEGVEGESVVNLDEASPIEAKVRDFIV